MSNLSPFQRHVENWKECQRCILREQRTKVVIARGQVPCDVLFLGEAPGQCLCGDTLIETAYRDKSIYPQGIPIKHLINEPPFPVYSYDTIGRCLSIGMAKNVRVTGVRPLFEVAYFWWGGKKDGSGGRERYFNKIKVTDNHPFLLKSGKYQSILQGLRVGSSLQPFYRRESEYQFVGVSADSLRRETHVLIERAIGRELERDEEIHHHDRNKWNDNIENLVLTNTVKHARLHGLEDNPMFIEEHRETHRRIVESDEYRTKMSQKMQEVLARPEVRTARLEQIKRSTPKTAATVKSKFANDPIYYYHYLLGKMRQKNAKKMTPARVKELMLKKFPEVPYPPTADNHEIYAITYAGIEPVYDMEVEQYHNFATQGIFIHNSEDLFGIPFVGPAGHLLDQIVAQAMPLAYADGENAPSTGNKFRTAYINIVGCYPREAKRSDDHAPPIEAIRACSAKVREFVTLARPKLVVCVGDTAKKYVHLGVDTAGGIEVVHIVHPAAILGHMPHAQKGLAINKCVVTLATALDALS